MIPAVAAHARFDRWPYLQLMRPANLVTAAADVLAGYAVAGLPPPQVLPLLVVSGVLLYAGGVVMNDVFDTPRDRYARPERPIPSGRVHRVAAAAWGMSLLTMGVAAAFSVGVVSGAVASLLALGALLYNAIAKHYAWLGPATMGACRGLNLLLGISAAPAALLGGGVVALVPMFYVAGITLASRGEVDGGSRRTVALTILLIAMAIAWLLLITRGAQAMLVAAAPFVALLLIGVGTPLCAAWRRPNATRLRAVVKRGVMSIIVVDAAIAAAYAGFVWGVVLLMLALPASQLSSRFAVT